MPDCFEDICPVGECSVCEGWVDKAKSGYCEECGSAFHWGICGGWFGGKQMCENCMENLENEED